MSGELTIGTVLGRYELLWRLGRGGMASVWVARERASLSGQQRLIAVKAMLPELASRQDFRRMFLEEGQIVRSIEHRNVVKVYEVAEDQGVLYMAMEWVEGDSLRAVIREAKRRRAIPPEMAVRMIADTAAGLHAAHELRDWNGELRGVVHCDVSPHNILIGLDGRAKLVDFGVANATAHSDVGDKDRIKGKFSYMSPEQANAERLDRRSDLFSLGIVLFELTTGERLFKGDSPKETLELVSAAQVPKPTEIYSKYPPRLEQIVLKALARDPSERFQTGEEFRLALERYFVEERILVARSSVSQLLKRVLGARLAQQREAVREALRVLDGELASGLVPSESTLPSPDLVAASEASFTGRSLPSWSGSFAPFGASPTSDPPSASYSQFSHHSGTTRPQTLERRRATRSPLVVVLGTAAAVAAVVAAVLWTLRRPDALPTIAAAEPQSAESRGAHADRPTADGPKRQRGPGGVAFDSLPLDDEQQRTDAGAPIVARQPTGSGAAPASRTSKSSRGVPVADNPYKSAQREPSGSASPKAEAARKSSQQASASGTPASRADEPAQGGASLPAPDKRPPLNQGAAIAALGAASSSASGCKRPGGPSGSGRATVTFSPDGHVSRVSVSAPFSGTPVGSCVAGAFRRARVPAFRGSAVTLSRSFRIPD